VSGAEGRTSYRVAVERVDPGTCRNSTCFSRCLYEMAGPCIFTAVYIHGRLCLGVGLLQVVELAPHVRPTGDFLDPTIFFMELIESSIGIGLQRTLKRTQMLLGKFTLAIGRVREPHGRCRRVACRPIIANIRPQTARLGLAALNHEPSSKRGACAPSAMRVAILRQRSVTELAITP
jgi:hypothetical protein